MAVRFQAPPQPGRPADSLRQFSLPPNRPTPSLSGLPNLRGASITLPQHRAARLGSLGMGEVARGGLGPQPRHASMPIGGFPSLGSLPLPGPTFPQLAGDLRGLGSQGLQNGAASAPGTLGSDVLSPSDQIAAKKHSFGTDPL